MSRFEIYARPEAQRPPKGAWPPLRIFAWSVLWAVLMFAGWVAVTHR
jgi:hypothetical protein